MISCFQKEIVGAIIYIYSYVTNSGQAGGYFCWGWGIDPGSALSTTESDSSGQGRLMFTLVGLRGVAKICQGPNIASYGIALKACEQGPGPQFKSC